MVEHQTTMLLRELAHLTAGMKDFGALEAAMRVRAFAELSAKLSTEALLEFAAKLTPDDIKNLKA